MCKNNSENKQSAVFRTRYCLQVSDDTHQSHKEMRRQAVMALFYTKLCFLLSALLPNLTWKIITEDLPQP